MSSGLDCSALHSNDRRSWEHGENLVVPIGMPDPKSRCQSEGNQRENQRERVGKAETSLYLV